MAISNNLGDFLTEVASAIREKAGTTDLINAQSFPSAIRNLPTGGGGQSFEDDIMQRNIQTYTNSRISYIGSYALGGCLSLSAVDLPVCKNIGRGAFSGCSLLVDVNIPQCERLGSYAFAGCESLESISFPYCSDIGDGAFIDDYDLKYASFPECLQIRDYAFSECDSLISISFPKCQSIRRGAFEYCINLTEANFPECLTILSGVFLYCESLESVNFPVCSKIESTAFEWCSSLKHIGFPACTRIEYSAFASCTSLQSANFPVCSSVGDRAFRYCTSLQRVNLPVCEFIGSTAFGGCTKLSELHLMSVSSVPILSNIEVFQNTPMSNSSYLGYFGSIYVPQSLYNSFIRDTNWITYSARIVGVPPAASPSGAYSTVSKDGYAINSFEIVDGVVTNIREGDGWGMFDSVPTASLSGDVMTITYDDYYDSTTLTYDSASDSFTGQIYERTSPSKTPLVTVTYTKS